MICIICLISNTIRNTWCCKRVRKRIKLHGFEWRMSRVTFHSFPHHIDGLVRLQNALRDWGRDKNDATLNNFSHFHVKLHWSLFLWVQLVISKHWFRWWLGIFRTTAQSLNQWWAVSLTHIYVMIHVQGSAKTLGVNSFRFLCLFWKYSYSVCIGGHTLLSFPHMSLFEVVINDDQLNLSWKLAQSRRKPVWCRPEPLVWPV